MSQTPQRPQNECFTCGHSWHPRGHNRSRKCPNCGSSHLQIVPTNSSNLSGSTPWIGVGVLTFIGIGIVGSQLIKNKAQPEDKRTNDPPIVTLPNRDREPTASTASSKNTAKARDDKVIQKPDPVEEKRKAEAEQKLKEEKAEAERRKKKEEAEAEKRMKDEKAELDRRKKQELAENEAKFRLSSIKTFILDGKPEVALRFAKELIRLHPNSPEAKEAQTIIDQIMKRE